MKVSEALPSAPRLLKFPQTGDAHTGFTTTATPPALPFQVARTYWTYLTPDEVLRGHHAHRALEQVLFAVSGSLEITLENPAGARLHFTLTRPDEGLYLTGLYWRTIRFHNQAVLLCLASQPYSEASYIRDYTTFRSLAEQPPAP
jgi:hypothetical protein